MKWKCITTWEAFGGSRFTPCHTYIVQNCFVLIWMDIQLQRIHVNDHYIVYHPHHCFHTQCTFSFMGNDTLGVNMETRLVCMLFPNKFMSHEYLILYNAPYSTKFKLAFLRILNLSLPYHTFLPWWQIVSFQVSIATIIRKMLENVLHENVTVCVHGSYLTSKDNTNIYFLWTLIYDRLS